MREPYWQTSGFFFLKTDLCELYLQFFCQSNFWRNRNTDKLHKKTEKKSKLDTSSKNSCAQSINLSTCGKVAKTRKNRVVHKVIHFIHSGYPLFHWWINPVNPKQMFCIKSINLSQNEKKRICKTKEIVWQFFVQKKKLLLFSKISWNRRGIVV